MGELIVKAELYSLDEVLEFIMNELEKEMCPMKTQMMISIATEEIFVNIANYAYQGEKGNVIIKLEITDNPKQAMIQFWDGGIPYNPLEKEDPDIHQDIMEREIGGLGIYMVKNSMKHVYYNYVDNQNVLTIEKDW
ncbi:MAG: ATP-binding protein [Lachnospiraceae bacterium]|nr:ATP-binding protein [Lachnospiraceae bacterium]